jgi:hypothetical protein
MWCEIGSGRRSRIARSSVPGNTPLPFYISSQGPDPPAPQPGTVDPPAPNTSKWLLSISSIDGYCVYNGLGVMMFITPKGRSPRAHAQGVGSLLGLGGL